MSEATLKDLSATIQRVLPFVSKDGTRETFRHIWVESAEGVVSFTASDGFTLAQAKMDLDWPEGHWLLNGEAVGDLLSKALEELPATFVMRVAETPGTLSIATIGGVDIPVVAFSWMDYQPLIQQVRNQADSSLLTDQKSFKRTLRETKGDITGVGLSGGVARIFVAQTDKKTHSMETVEIVALPCQMVEGEGKAAFDRGTLARLVHCAGDWVGLKLQADGEKPVPALVEGPNYQAIVMTHLPFPKEALLSPAQRKLLDWLDEVLGQVRKGDVMAQIQVASGSLTITWDPEPTETTITFLDKNEEK